MVHGAPPTKPVEPSSAQSLVIIIVANNDPMFFVCVQKKPEILACAGSNMSQTRPSERKRHTGHRKLELDAKLVGNRYGRIRVLVFRPKIFIEGDPSIVLIIDTDLSQQSTEPLSWAGDIFEKRDP